MTPTPYATGTPVTVPPCHMHAVRSGVIILKPVILRERDSLPIIDYWIRFKDGELCLHPHSHVEVTSEH